MKSKIIFAFLALAGALHAAAETPPPKPNIVLIIADDLGRGDLGCFGCKDIPTPNIDRIASEGVRFTQAYAYNVCTPTRAALLTGCYAERNGMRGVLMGGSVMRFAQATTLPRVLGDAGYVTGLVGKWHLGYEGAVLPTRMGFKEFFGHRGGKIDYYKHTDSTQKGKHDLWEGETEVFREGYSTQLFTARARAFIRDHAREPFYLQVAYNAPHYPTKKGVYQAPPEYLRKFGVEGSPDNTRGGYAAMVSCLDDGVGEVLEEIRKQGLDERTLVIFMGDNGGEAKASNAPFSGGKHSNAEGGIRVPLIARWPRVIAAGSERAEPVHAMDMMPTLLHAAGVAAPASCRFDGVDAWSSYTSGKPPAERALFFGPDAIREGKWKLSKERLYDLEKDSAEKKDEAAAHPEVAAALRKQMENWRKELGVREKEKDESP